MVRELNMDTQRQNFWKEAIMKEAYVRLAWHTKYRNEVNHARNAVSSEASRIQKVKRNEKLMEMVPKPPPKTLAAKFHSKDTLPVIAYPTKEKKTASREVRSAGDALLVEMRPVTPKIRKSLYSGFTKEGKGRYQYLQARTFKKPEDKYEYPLTTSWEYGWRLDDVVKEFRAPQFGRSRIVRDTFFRRNGILYEPITA